MVYLDVTARNEWASQLAFTPHMNIFYPSVGLSAVISSMADLSKAGISFLKVRASYAEVGNAPQRFITGVNTPLQTGGIVSSDSYAPAVNLTPERTKSFEVGLNAKFLGNKIWTDVTYYNTNTYNQLFSYDAPPSTGYKRAYINAGKVNNWGIEAVVGYKNKWRDFSWSTNVNFSMNRNEVKELVPEGTRDVAGNLVTVDEVNMDYGGYRMRSKRRFDRRLLRDGAQDRRPGTHLCRPQYQYRHHRSQYVALRRQYRSPLPPGVEQPVLLQGREPRRAVRCPHRRPGRFGDAGPDGSLGCLAGFGRCPGKRRCLDLRGSESPRCQGLLRQQRQRAFDAFTLRLQHDQRPPA